MGSGRDHGSGQCPSAGIPRARRWLARSLANLSAPAPSAVWATLLVLAVFGLALAPTSGQDRAGETPALPETGGVYRRPLNNDPATLDPARVRDVYSLAVTQQIFDGLVQFDHKLTITPTLAQYWKASRDGLTWTFRLRRGVKFHHGREVTADDVIYSLTRLDRKSVV